MLRRKMYEWLKALHVFAVIVWMAGLFYLPRLFVYHSSERAGTATSETFKVMERRLLHAIMRPACVVTLLSGFGVMGVAGYAITETWLAMKLLGVAGMFVFHGYLEVCTAQFGRDERHRGSGFFRAVNEIPTVLLIWIVIWVVVKPFS